MRTKVTVMVKASPKPSPAEEGTNDVISRRKYNGKSGGGGGEGIRLDSCSEGEQRSHSGRNPPNRASVSSTRGKGVLEWDRASNRRRGLEGKRAVCGVQRKVRPIGTAEGRRALSTYIYMPVSTSPIQPDIMKCQGSSNPPFVTSAFDLTCRTASEPTRIRQTQTSMAILPPLRGRV